jgi:DNA-directed RNA polymerase specialized sigma subunit
MLTSEELIRQTVDYTIIKLKLSGLMKDTRQTAFQKTEQILRSYNDMKKAYSENGTAKKFVDIIDRALTEIEDDIYYEIIPMLYFEKLSRDDIAEYFETTTTTISRNKRRLIEKLKVLIFADDVIYELFL